MGQLREWTGKGEVCLTLGQVKLWNAYMNEECATALGNFSWACMVSNYSVDANIVRWYHGL